MADVNSCHRLFCPGVAVLAVGMLLLVASLAGGQTAPEAPAPPPAHAEHHIKLAYLCNFSLYVTWPAPAPVPRDGIWIIGTLGGDPFHGELDRLAASGREIRGRKVVVHHFAAVEHYQPCHILFVTKTTPPEHREAALRTLDGKQVLLVGETPDFAQIGGCVNFYRDGRNIRFEINREAIRRQQLQVSSKLLALAKIIEPGGDSP